VTLSRPNTYRKFQLVTAVWGKWFVDVFLNFGIPSLLAPGNIPRLCANGQGRYVIFTRRSDAERIAASDSFVRLSRHFPVEIEPYPDRFFAGNPHVIHMDLWGKAAKSAADRDEWIAFMIPDNITADGSLGHLADQFLAGKTSVYGIPLRVTEHTFLADADRLGHRSDGAWIIPARDLMRLAFENLSPLGLSYLRDTQRFGDHPELVLYPVPGEGMVLRAFIHHSLAVDPARLELTEAMSPRRADSPAEISFLTDSDQFICVSLTPISHQVDWFRERRRFNVVEAARLWDRVNHSATVQLARQSFVFHYQEMTPAKWRPAIARADTTVMLTFLTMKFLWVIGAARRAGMSLAADVMTWALLELKLHKSCGSREKVTVLVPTNDAFAKLGEGAVDRLLARPRMALATMLRNHCLRGDLATGKDGQKFVTLAGDQVEVSVSENSLRVAGQEAREIAIDDVNGGHIRVYAYDGVVGETPCSAG
jgi:fasciclin domain-containing protein